MGKLEDFQLILEELHGLAIPFTIAYTDPRDGDLLPITNDDNFKKAVDSAKPLLRIIVQRKGN